MQANARPTRDQYGYRPPYSFALKLLRASLSLTTVVIKNNGSQNFLPKERCKSFLKRDFRHPQQETLRNLLSASQNPIFKMPLSKA